MDQVKLHIATGALRPGDEMPSIRTLSVPLGVNPMTISKAYNFLVRENVLERRPGLPLVVGQLDETVVRESRISQLQMSLKPAANLARQLGLSSNEASQILKRMMDDSDRSAGPTEVK